MKTPTDLWTHFEDCNLIAAYHLGSEKTAEIVSAANIRSGRDKARTATACKRRICVLRDAGHIIPKPILGKGPHPMENRQLRAPTLPLKCISKPLPDKQPDPKPRKCLSCRDEFPSEGAHNHVCPDCKQTSAWTSASMEPGNGNCGRRISGGIHDS